MAGLVALVVTPGVAFAAGDGPFRTSQYSTCSKAWNYSSYGASGRATLDYDSYRVSLTKFRIIYAKSGVDHLEDCGPGGGEVRAYTITTRTDFEFFGTGVSCSANVGYPPSLGLTCTTFDGGVRLTAKTTCGTKVHYVLTCPSTFGQFDVLAKSGAIFSNYVLVRTYIILKRDDGGTHQWGTDYI